MLAWHAFVVITLGAVMVYYVDGLKVNSKDRYSDQKTYLRASDITTVITGALVIVRIASTSWSALASWRCVYVLLENNGLDLEQLDWMVSWRLPRTKTGKYSWLVILTLCLIWPSQFAAPLLSGAVDLKSVEGFAPNGSVWMRGADANYSWYAESVNYRRPRVNQAVMEFASVSMAASTQKQSNHSCRRYIEIDKTLPLGSTVENVIFPCITIHSISWNKAPLATAIDKLLVFNSNLSITDAPNPIFHTMRKYLTTAMLNLETWQNQSSEPKFNVKGTIPPPSLFKGGKEVAVLLSPEYEICENVTTQSFGPSSPEVVTHNVIWPTQEEGFYYEPCFQVATLNFTAGVARAPMARLISESVLEPEGDLEIQADPFVTQALYLMPEVMATVSDMNFTQMPTWQNRDGYVKSLVRYTYHTTWNSMQTKYSNESSECQVSRRVEMLEVLVSRSRVAYWLGINALLTLSGFVLLIIERNSVRPVVLDFAAGAITMDSSAVLGRRRYEHELTKMSYVTRKDAKIGKLRLVRVDDEFALTPSDSRFS